jgi:hypothetical protein
MLSGSENLRFFVEERYRHPLYIGWQGGALLTEQGGHLPPHACLHHVHHCRLKITERDRTMDEGTLKTPIRKCRLYW